MVLVTPQVSTEFPSVQISLTTKRTDYNIKSVIAVSSLCCLLYLKVIKIANFNVRCHMGLVSSCTDM